MTTGAFLCFVIGLVGFYAMAWWLDWVFRPKLSKADQVMAQLNSGEITINQARKELGLESLPPSIDTMMVSGVATCRPGQPFLSQWPYKPFGVEPWDVKP